MFRVRQFIVSYLLVLACAGPAPLWLHQWLDHSCCSETTSRADQQPAKCHDCVYCKHAARTATDSGEADVPTQVRQLSECNDCWVCYQLSQSTERTADIPAPLAAELIGTICVASYESPTIYVVGMLGPRGPPSVIEAC